MQVIQLVDDEEIISDVTFDNYLKNDFIPYVRGIYDVSVKTFTTIDDVFRQVMLAVEKLNLTKNEVSMTSIPC
jgi:hypothetical protein